MREFLSTIILPLPVFWFLVLAGAILLLKKRKKAAKIVMVLAVVEILLVSTPFLPDFLLGKLETEYPALLHPELVLEGDTANIIVLGGGHASDFSMPPNDQLSTTALGRLCEGIRLHRLLPGSRLVLSGWGDKDRQSQAKVLYNTALVLGVLAAEMDTLSKSRRTAEEAANYKLSFGTKQKVIVVSDASHLPRAMMEFRKQGLNAIAAPTNHIFKHTNNPIHISSYFPSSGNIMKMEMAVHEVVGIAVMKSEK